MSQISPGLVHCLQDLDLPHLGGEFQSIGDEADGALYEG